MTSRPAELPVVEVDAPSPAGDVVAASAAPFDLSGALLRKCISSLNDTLLVAEALPLDEPGPRILFVNEAFERQTGYTLAEVVGRSPRFLQGPKTDRAELDRIRAALERLEIVRAELTNYKKNGEEFTVEMDIVPVADASGKCTHWVSIQRNVTARKHAEAQAKALDTQRMESVARLSMGIAHDFNNIVAAILGNTAIGRQTIAGGQMPSESLEQITTAALRARSLVQKILAFGSHQPQDFTAELLSPIVREASDLARSTLSAGLTLTVKIAVEPLWALADASQLYQVVLNLATNATYAMRGTKGVIHIELDAVDTAFDTNGPAAASHGPDGRHDASRAVPRLGRIRVTDTGCGMDAATQARMFEPYFTTKRMGHGTGLGLSVVWGIVTAHGGTISVQSEVGHGSQFVLLFPLVDALQAPAGGGGAAASEPAPLSPAVGRGAHVMVIDDDEVVMVMFERMLTRCGFDVSAFADPFQALALLKASPYRFDAIVTDMHMPTCSGLDLARDIAAVRHDLPVLIGSGYVDEALTEAAARAGVAAVFCKEFAVEELGGLLHQALARLPG